MSTRTFGHGLAVAPAVVSVRDLHVWEVTSGFAALIVVAVKIEMAVAVDASV